MEVASDIVHGDSIGQVPWVPQSARDDVTDCLKETSFLLHADSRLKDNNLESKQTAENRCNSQVKGKAEAQVCSE